MLTLADGLCLSLDAAQQAGEAALDSVSGRSCAAPLTVPEEGVMSWELAGGQTVTFGTAEISKRVEDQFTLAIWCKLLPPAQRQPGTLIAGADGSVWVAIGKEGLGLGPVELDASAPMPPLATMWHLLILGGTSRGAASSTTLCALKNPGRALRSARSRHAAAFVPKSGPHFATLRRARFSREMHVLDRVQRFDR